MSTTIAFSCRRVSFLKTLKLLGVSLSLLVATQVNTDAADKSQALFEQNCAVCHTIGEGTRIGPDLQGVVDRRDHDWLVRWITHPDQMIAEGDPIAKQLLSEFNQVPMPNLNITPEQAEGIIKYLASAKPAAPAVEHSAPAPTVEKAAPVKFSWSTQYTAGVIFVILTILIVLVFRGVAITGRKNPVDTIDTVSAYHLRHKIFIFALIVVTVILVATMTRLPYSESIIPPDQVIYVTAQQFSFAYSAEPIQSKDDITKVEQISSLVIPADAFVEFRVTSLDVNHGFGIYDPEGHIISQVQAMPGYTNRLQVHFPEAGKYTVLCLEYCGSAHQLMHSGFTVE